jgi:hypothetical protein
MKCEYWQNIFQIDRSLRILIGTLSIRMVIWVSAYLRLHFQVKCCVRWLRYWTSIYSLLSKSLRAKVPCRHFPFSAYGEKSLPKSLIGGGFSGFILFSDKVYLKSREIEPVCGLTTRIPRSVTHIQMSKKFPLKFTDYLVCCCYGVLTLSYAITKCLKTFVD